MADEDRLSGQTLILKRPPDTQVCTRDVVNRSRRAVAGDVLADRLIRNLDAFVRADAFFDAEHRVVRAQDLAEPLFSVKLTAEGHAAHKKHPTGQITRNQPATEPSGGGPGRILVRADIGRPPRGRQIACQANHRYAPRRYVTHCAVDRRMLARDEQNSVGFFRHRGDAIRQLFGADAVRDMGFGVELDFRHGQPMPLGRFAGSLIEGLPGFGQQAKPQRFTWLSSCWACKPSTASGPTA
jgi:hypothetical protein